jgi:hypothetical protein
MIREVSRESRMGANPIGMDFGMMTFGSASTKLPANENN